MAVISIENQKQIIWDFIKRHSLCVLATANPKGSPEAAGDF